MTPFQTEDKRLKNFWNTRYKNFSLQESGIKGFSKPGSELLYTCKLKAYTKAVKLTGISQNSIVSVLDVGCGQGFYGEKIRKLLPRASYTGIDISQKVINYLKKHLPKLQWICKNFTSLDFPPSKKYDLIQVIEVLHLTIDDRIQQQGLTNLAGCLKTGGYLIITDTLPTARETIKDYIVFRPLSYYRKIFRQQRLKIIKIFPMYYCYPDLGLKLRPFPPEIIYWADRLFLSLKLPQFPFGHDSQMKMIIVQKIHG